MRRGVLHHCANAYKIITIEIVRLAGTRKGSGRILHSCPEIKCRYVSAEFHFPKCLYHASMYVHTICVCRKKNDRKQNCSVTKFINFVLVGSISMDNATSNFNRPHIDRETNMRHTRYCTIMHYGIKNKHHRNSFPP